MASRPKTVVRIHARMRTYKVTEEYITGQLEAIRDVSINQFSLTLKSTMLVKSPNYDPALPIAPSHPYRD